MSKVISLLAAGLQVQAAFISITRSHQSEPTSFNSLPDDDQALRVYQGLTYKYNDAIEAFMAIESIYEDVLNSYGDAFSSYQQALTRSCPPPSTITVIQAPPVVTVVADDPKSIASTFLYASGIDSMVNQNSQQDRPTGDTPETTSIFFTHTASGPAVVGTDDPNDGTILYHFSVTTLGPVATTVVGFPPADPPKPTAQPPTRPQEANSTYTGSRSHSIGTVTITTYLSTITITPSPPITTAPATASLINHNSLEKRQTCSMIYAKINGQWASWCNNWDGSKVLSYSTYETTIVLTDVFDAPPIPTSVYNPATVTHTRSSQHSAELTTATSIVSVPVTTITVVHTGTPPAPSPTCGEQHDIRITFDDLPAYSNSDKNSTIVPPIFDPYRHFFWTDGYGYGPEPPVPFYPVDGTRMGMYQPEKSFIPSTAIEGRDQPGSFGAGPRAGSDIYWFNAGFVHIGCNTTEPCVIAATGYRWHRPDEDPNSGYEQVAFVQHAKVASICPTRPCNMTEVVFDIKRFSGLSTLNMQAYAGTETVGFYFDSFQGSWTNETCQAGLERQSSRKM